jgi:hemoglobin-like flavoprotein
MIAQYAELIRSSWPSVAERAGEVASIFYARLFEIDDGAARLFAHVDMLAQEAKLVRTLATVVQRLDDPGELLASLGGLAKRHASYRVELHHFDSVGDALLWALADTLGPQFTPELRSAWTEAYALIASVMKRAIERSTVSAS